MVSERPTPVERPIGGSSLSEAISGSDDGECRTYGQLLVDSLDSQSLVGTNPIPKLMRKKLIKMEVFIVTKLI